MDTGGECVLCGAKDFMLSDGLFFCSECGTQSQHVREEVTTKDDPSPFVRTIRMSAVKKEGKQSHSEGDVTVVEKFQLVLQLQCDALIELGCDPSVKEAVRLIWFRYLKYSGYAFEDSVEPDVVTSHDKFPEWALKTRKMHRNKEAGSQLNQKVIKAKASKRLCQSSSPAGDNDHPTLTPHVTKKARFCDSDCTSSGASTSNTGKGSPSKAKRKSRGSKSSGGDDVRRKIDFKCEASESDEDRPNPLEELPDDSHLFSDSVQSLMDQYTDVKDPGTSTGGTSSTADVDLYRDLLREEGNSHMRYLSLKHTIAICYLGLLYTQQHVLLADYVRWIRLHKVPYHNILGLLPRSYFLGRNIYIFRSHVDFDADRLYRLLRNFCWYLPLPPIPPISASQMCHTLLEKLHLPLYFQKMVDRVLRCIYCPVFDAGFVSTVRSFDVDCMVIIIHLLRLIYRLDDVYEFEMIEMVREEDSWEESDYIYLWEDWIALYSKDKLASFSNAVPVSRSELSNVNDHSKFVDFCRDDVFFKARAFPVTADHLRHWNPNYYQGLSEIFKQAAQSSSSSEPAPPSVVEEKFKPPRRLYITDLLQSPSVPWKEFSWFQRELKCNKMHNIDLSRSLSFLLKTCSEILDVSVPDLYDRLTHMEGRFAGVVDSLKNVKLLMTELYGVEPNNSTALSQDTHQDSILSDSSSEEHFSESPNSLEDPC